MYVEEIALSSSPFRSFRVRQTGMGCLHIGQAKVTVKGMNDALFRFKPLPSQKLGQEWDNPLVRQEHSILLQQRATSLEGLKFALQLLHSDYS